MWQVCKRIQNISFPQVVLLFFFLGFTTYANAIFHPFVHDDIVFIQENPSIDQLSLRSIFNYTAAPFRRETVVNTYYRPLLELIYRLEYKIFGLNPHGYHLFNILTHIANSILVYCIFMLIFPGQKMIVFSSAALFLLHPVQSEAVACISGISNLCFSFWGLLSLYFYILSAQKKTSRNIFFYGLFLFAFFIALLAKEQAVTVLFLIALFELCCGKDSEMPHSAHRLRWLGGGVVFAGYLALRKCVLANALGFSVIFNAEFWLRLLAIPQTLLMYLKVFFFPFDLHYYRSVDILRPFLLPLLGLALIAFMCIYYLKKQSHDQRKVLIFGLGWFILTLAPTLNIIPLVNEYSWILTSEHFLYLPIAGLIVCVLKIATDLIKRFFPQTHAQASTLILVIVLFLCLGLTVKQNTYWKDEVALFERTLRFEKLGRVHILLARAYYQQGNYEGAVREDQKALEVFSSYLKKISNKQVEGIYLGFMKGAYFDLAHSYESMQNPLLAIDSYEKALVIDPLDSTLHNNAGVAYAKAGNLNTAVKHFEKAVFLDDLDFGAKFNLALGYAQQGELDKAKVLLIEIIEKDKTQRATLAQRMLNDLAREEKIIVKPMGSIVK